MSMEDAQIDRIKLDITNYGSAAEKKLLEIKASIHSLVQISSLLDQNQKSYVDIVGNYKYDHNETAIHTMNIEPRFSTAEMAEDSEVISELKQTSESLESERIVEISRLERTFKELGSFLGGIRDSSSDLSLIWKAKIRSSET
jgi:hypothetical protein